MVAPQSTTAILSIATLKIQFRNLKLIISWSLLNLKQNHSTTSFHRLVYLLLLCLIVTFFQVLPQIYIYKAEKPSVCLSVTPITHLGRPTVTYQLPNIINPSSSYLKFVTMSECGDQIAFCSRLKTKKWRKLEQHSIENHSHMAQLVVQLTCIQEVVDSSPGGEQLFFLNINTFANTFF